MRKSKKNSKQPEQIRISNPVPAKIEPLRPKAEHPDKLYNDLAKFPSENPYPIMRIHKDGTVMYANKASEPLLKAKGGKVGAPAPKEWHRLVENVLASGLVAREEVKDNGRVFALRAVPIAESGYVNFYGVDITEQKMAEEERELMIELLSLINSNNQLHELMKLVSVLLKDWSGCEAVGIRLQEGEDFPYFETSGFPEEFILAESKLCSVNEIGELVRDSQGRPFLECMCGNIISGRFDPSKPFFTKHGSFWTNSTTELLAGTTNADRLTKTRNRCNTAGYESLALIPLRAGEETFGLLQFNSKQKGLFFPEKISLLERLADNLAIGLAQRKADNALRESENKFKTLADEAFDSIVIHDGQRIIEANKAFCRLWGYNPKEAVGLKIDKFFAPECCEDVKKRIQSGYDRPYEADTIRKDGMRFQVEIAGKAITYKGNTVRIATARDITERKRAEEDLRRSEESYRVTFENTGSATVLIEDDTIISLANTEFARLSGFSKQEIEGKKSWTEFVVKEDLARMLEQHRLRRVNKEAAMKQYEFRFVTRTGNIRDIALLIDVIPGTKRSVAALMDITERKLAEEELLWKTAFLESQVEANLDGMLVVDSNNQKILTNKRLIEMWKVPQHIAEDKDDTALLQYVVGQTKYPEQFLEKVKYLYSHQDQTSRDEIEFKNGMVFDRYSSPVVDKNGKYFGRIWTFRDITERKRAEENLKAREEFLDNIIEQTPNSIWISDEHGTVIRMNQAIRDLLELTDEEITGKYNVLKDVQVIEQGFLPLVKSVFEEGKTVNFVIDYHTEKERQVELARKTNKVLDIVISAIKNKDGKVVNAICQHKDITEQKRAKEALRQSEAKFYKAFHTSPNLMAITTLQEARIIEINEAYCRVTGFKREECIGHTTLELNLWANKEQRNKIIQKVKAEGYVNNVEVGIRTKSGEIRALIFSMSTITLNDEKHLLSVAMDITDLKLAQDNLQNERNLLRTLIDHIPDKVYVKDKDSRFIVCNKTVSDYWKAQDQDDLVGKTDFDLFEPAQAQKFFDEEQKVMRTSQPVINKEGYCENKNGKTDYLLVTKTPLRDSQGNVTGLLGIHRNITARRLSEEKLLEYQQRLKRLAAQLALAEERERRRIAGELHDHVNQSLALAKIKLDSLQAALSSQPMAGVIEDISDSIEKAIQDTRTLTFDLSNPILYELGFEAAVSEWLDENVRVKHKINTEFQDDGQDKPLDDDMRALLFRNVRELLINTIKYSGADKVRVSVRRIDGSIEVVVEDNGVGFDPDEVRTLASKRAEFGLFSIRESLEQLGGRFEIESKPGAGCKATMTAPLKSQSRKKEE